jgi:deazaflavin-dependent oxidoreductase (nitroreductase family)
MMLRVCGSMTAISLRVCKLTRNQSLFRPSIVCLLSVRGRRTGQWRSTSIAVLEYDGQRFLVAAYGDTEWSRNLHAADSGRLSRHGWVEEFRAVEVPVEQRAPLIEAYPHEFGGLPTVGRTFRALPNPADHSLGTFRERAGSWHRRFWPAPRTRATSHRTGSRTPSIVGDRRDFPTRSGGRLSRAGRAA